MEFLDDDRDLVSFASWWGVVFKCLGIGKELRTPGRVLVMGRDGGVDWCRWVILVNSGNIRVWNEQGNFVWW
jgi:hypothetical protein